MDNKKFQKEEKKSANHQENGGKKVAPSFSPNAKKADDPNKQKTNEKDMSQSQERKPKEQNRSETRN